MSYVIFDNPGEIDPLMIRTFGVSVKETSNPIGFFGTGLKYAIAILLREQNEITIQAGLQTLKVGCVQRTMRGEVFNLVAIDDEPLGFTDQVGKSWQLWMAYRELYCNCADEDGAVRVVTEIPAAEAGRTRFIVKGPKFLEQHHRRASFILEGKPIHKLDGSEVYPGEARGIFYRGMLVHAFPDRERSRYTYNMTRSIELTEDRTAKYAFMFPNYLARDILASEDEALLTDLLAVSNKYFESHIDFRSEGKPTPQFLRVVEELSKDKRGKINTSAAQVFKQEVRSKLTPEARPLHGVETETLRRAIAFANSLGFDVERYPIIVTDTLGDNILGMAEDGRIYLSKRAFLIGTKTVAGTLIEEFIHLKFGLEDETREMQNFLLDKLVSIGEELGGQPL